MTVTCMQMDPRRLARKTITQMSTLWIYSTIITQRLQHTQNVERQ